MGGVDTRGSPSEPAGPLAGFTVGVTAERRAAELGALLERYGAAVVYGPAMRTVPLADDGRLLDATRSIIDVPPGIVVATTGTGFRGWLEAAGTHDLAGPLLDALRGSAVFTRGPKARGAVRAAGLRERWSPPSEASGELLAHLLERGVAGQRVAVQLHGEPLADFRAALADAGAEVVAIPVYRWTAPPDPAPLDALIDAAIAGTLDAITFTSAPAATGLLTRATGTGRGAPLTTALGAGTGAARVLAVCVGTVTARPLEAAGIPVVWPQRARVAAMVRLLGEELATPRTDPTRGRDR